MADEDAGPEMEIKAATINEVRQEFDLPDPPVKPGPPRVDVGNGTTIVQMPGHQRTASVPIKPDMSGVFLHVNHPSFKNEVNDLLSRGVTPKEIQERIAEKYHTIHDMPPGRLPDWAIRKFCPIKPFVEMGESEKGAIGYGLSSAGYDIRIGYKFKIFTSANQGTLVDPKAFDEKCFNYVDLTPDGPHSPQWDNGDVYRCHLCGKELIKAGDIIDPPCPKSKPDAVILPPNSFLLAESVEWVHIPRETTVIVLGKSTLARCGLIANFTPLEPGWRGIITIEISNSTPLPAKIYAGEGIAQLLYDKMAFPPAIDYDQKPSKKYQDQTGLTDPIG